MSNYITTHNSEGKAIFSDKIPTEQHKRPMQPGGDIEQASLTDLYTLNSFNPNLSTEKDIEEYAETRVNGLAPGRICPENGTSVGIATFGAGMESPWHLTMTIDTALVLEGSLELHLDSGESKVLNAGDSYTQRATMHKWKNVTPEGGKARMLAIAQPIAESLEIAGKKLEAEWVF